MRQVIIIASLLFGSYGIWAANVCVNDDSKTIISINDSKVTIEAIGVQHIYSITDSYWSGHSN